MRFFWRLTPVLAAALALGGCGLFFGEPEAPPLPGERVSVLQLDRSLAADPALADLKVRLPPPVANAAWPQAGGNATHAMHHLALPDTVRLAWRADVGRRAGRSQRILAEPVVADGRVYAMDAGATVSAFETGGGRLLWRVDLTPEEEEDDLFGGGLAYADGRLFVTTPFARVYALDAGSGAEIWQSGLPGPARAPPTVSDGRVFAMTIDNQLVALAADDGRRLWSHVAVAEGPSLLGGAPPAVAGSTVIAPYTTGELFALRAETGAVLWFENLAGAARGDVVSALTDIRGRPVIDRDLVIAISHSGLIAGIDLRRGGRAWDNSIGGTESPWVAGDFVYVLNNNAELVALTRSEGRVRWVQSLPLYEDPEDREGLIYWAGPVLAGDRLIVTGSHGEAWSLSPYTGEILGRIGLPGGTHLPPVIAGETIYLLLDNAELIALR